MGLLILKYSALLSFHRVLHERDSMTGNKVVTYIWVQLTLLYIYFYNTDGLAYYSQLVKVSLLLLIKIELNGCYLLSFMGALKTSHRFPCSRRYTTRFLKPHFRGRTRFCKGIYKGFPNQPHHIDHEVSYHEVLFIEGMRFCTTRF